MIRAAAVVLAASVALACSDGSDGAAPASTTTDVPESMASSTTAPPDYSGGDPDSAFCEAVRDAAGRPLLDPFESGLDADEVELRLRALVVRFTQLAEQAPDALRDDLEDLSSALGELEETLAGFGHDLGAAGEAGVDLSAVDDPRFAGVAVRLGAYSQQVCGVG